MSWHASVCLYPSSFVVLFWVVQSFQAPGLSQAGKEGFPTMPLSVYVPKELVFALFTPLQPLQHLQPKQEYKQSSFLKHYSMTDQW